MSTVISITEAGFPPITAEQATEIFGKLKGPSTNDHIDRGLGILETVTMDGKSEQSAATFLARARVGIRAVLAKSLNDDIAEGNATKGQVYDLAFAGVIDETADNFFQLILSYIGDAVPGFADRAEALNAKDIKASGMAEDMIGEAEESAIWTAFGLDQNAFKAMIAEGEANSQLRDLFNATIRTLH